MLIFILIYLKFSKSGRGAIKYKRNLFKTVKDQYDWLLKQEMS